MLSPGLSVPSKMRTSMMTPRKTSYHESISRSRSGAFSSPVGAGMCSIARGKQVRHALPRLRADLQRPRCVQLKGRPQLLQRPVRASAVGRSILFTTGRISSPCAKARKKFATVCAWTPCDASTSGRYTPHEAWVRVDLAAEIDVARRVHKMEEVVLAAVAANHRASLGLDCDAALALDVELVLRSGVRMLAACCECWRPGDLWDWGFVQVFGRTRICRLPSLQ